MKCPFCLDIEMKVAAELPKGWYQCPNCGGTEVENPATGQGGSLVAFERNDATGKLKYRPADGVVGRARRARERKK